MSAPYATPHHRPHVVTVQNCCPPASARVALTPRQADLLRHVGELLRYAAGLPAGLPVLSVERARPKTQEEG